MIADRRPIPGRVLTPDIIVREVKHLPSAPKVLPRLKALLSDANSSMPEIVALIRLDPGISARVLQMGNSAFFNAGARCVTVEESVNRVGFDQVYQLVSYAVASEVLERPLATYGVDAEQLWRMSVAGALAAEALAAATGLEQDAAYTVGLMHCVGMVALDEWLRRSPRPAALIREPYPKEAVAAERSILGFTQAEVGGSLLLHWGFPGEIAEPVRWQYAPGATAAYRRMASLLNAARWLRDVACGATPSQAPDPTVLKNLGLDPDRLDELTAAVAVRLGEVQVLLGDGAGASPVARELFPSAALPR